MFYLVFHKLQHGFHLRHGNVQPLSNLDPSVMKHLLCSRKYIIISCKSAKPRTGILHGRLILQAFSRFTYVTAHSPTLLSLYPRHNSFSNPSVASPMSQLIHQPFFRFSYVTGFSLTSPGEPPMVSWKLITR